MGRSDAPENGVGSNSQLPARQEDAVMDAPTATGQQSQASAAFRSEDDHLLAELAGTWQLEHASPRFEPLVEAALASGKSVV